MKATNLQNKPDICPFCSSNKLTELDSTNVEELRSGKVIHCKYISYACEKCGATFTDWFDINEEDNSNIYQGKFFIEDEDGEKYPDLYIDKELQHIEAS